MSRPLVTLHTPRGMAAGNQLAAALVLLPLLPFLPPISAPTPLVIANVVALAVLASGVAFVLYFRLIADIGATRALTVTIEPEPDSRMRRPAARQVR